MWLVATISVSIFCRWLGRWNSDGPIEHTDWSSLRKSFLTSALSNIGLCGGKVTCCFEESLVTLWWKCKCRTQASICWELRLNDLEIMRYFLRRNEAWFEWLIYWFVWVLISASAFSKNRQDLLLFVGSFFVLLMPVQKCLASKAALHTVYACNTGTLWGWLCLWIYKYFLSFMITWVRYFLWEV